MSTARRLHPLEQPLPSIFSGTYHANQATSRVCISGTCECTPYKFSKIEDLRVGSFVQVTRTLFEVGLPHPTFQGFKVVQIDPDSVVLHENVDKSFIHRNSPMHLFWSGHKSAFSDSVGDVFLYSYGFISDISFVVGSPQMTHEFAGNGVYLRPVYDLRCMRGNCRLTYDGAEHGIFRLSKISSFCISLFYLFDQAKITQRCVYCYCVSYDVLLYVL
jgi:hypothetical protein